MDKVHVKAWRKVRAQKARVREKAEADSARVCTVQYGNGERPKAWQWVSFLWGIPIRESREPASAPEAEAGSQTSIG